MKARSIYAAALTAVLATALVGGGTASVLMADEVVKIARPSTEYDGWSYEDVAREFEEAGFTNIVLEPIGDLNFATAIITPDGRVESITVGESTGFTKEAEFSSDIPVVITYHTFQSTIDEAAKQAVYDEATMDFEAGKYTVAAEKFESLGNWSDAEARAMRSREEQRVVDMLATNPEAAPITVPRASVEFDGWSYWDVRAEFEKTGFTDVDIEPVGDLFIGLGNHDGQVEVVTVDGQEAFSAEAEFLADVPVVIRFHTYQSRIDRGDYLTGEGQTAPEDSQRYYLGTAQKTGLDNGYSDPQQVGVDDLQYGWKLGDFFCGRFYARERR